MKRNQIRNPLRMLSSITRNQSTKTQQEGTHIGLESLPDEILYQIFELISPQQRVPLQFQPDINFCFWEYEEPTELLHIVRCSRRLYNIGIPFLYNTFTQSSPQAWVPFMWTTFERPDLVDCVNNLKLSTRRYYEVLITNGRILSKDYMDLMSYHLESRTIDDQIAALTIENDAQGQAGESSRPLEPLVVNRSRQRATAAESLSMVQSGKTSASTLDSFIQIFRRGASSLRSSPARSIPSTGLPVSHDTETIVRNIIMDDWKAVATYLIYRIPHLVTLTLEEDKYHPHSSENLEPIIQRALSPQSINMPRFRKFILIYTRRCNTSKFDTYWPLLLQPSLRSFSATKVQEYGWMPNPRDLKLPLTHLSLDKCNLSSSSIDAFLKCCPNLEYLYYSHVQSWDEQPFLPRMFSSSIQHLKETLKELVLHRGELQYQLANTSTYEFYLLDQSLKTFTKLKRLDVTAHLLVGPQKVDRSMWWKQSQSQACSKQGIADGLPASLELLCLRDCGELIWDEIDTVMNGNRDGVRRLKTIKAVFHPRLKGEDIIDEDAFETRCLREEVVDGLKAQGIWEVKEDSA